jgi:carboxylesterase
VLAVPLWLNAMTQRMSEKIPQSWLMQRIAIPKIAGSDIRDPEMRRANKIAQGRAGMPLLAVYSLVQCMAHVRAHLPDVKTPLFVGHSRRDNTAPFACMQEIANKTSAPTVEQLVLEESYHCITIDCERQHLFAALEKFFDAHV